MAEPTPIDADLDILVLGAGPVGMTLALALAGSPWRVRLVERRPLLRQRSDPRALALSHGTRQLLEPLGAWPRTATPIETIHISQRGGFGRTVLDRRDYRLPALGYVVRYGDLADALMAALPADCILDETEAGGIETDGSSISVSLRRGDETRRARARLLVHAEGSAGDLAASRVRDYGQRAVVAEVRTDPPNGYIAWERFTPDGPLALLPLGDAYALVLTLPPEKAAETMRLDDAAFLARLQQQFGERLRFVATGHRACFPLALQLRHDVVQGREIWIGNTAQTLHPVSGQGFNLGLRDAVELAERLASCTDPGDPAVLTQHARRRRLDRLGGAVFTDSIVRLFSNDLPPLRMARGLGLLALDLLPPVRHFVAKRMIWGARAWP